MAAVTSEFQAIKKGSGSRFIQAGADRSYSYGVLTLAVPVAGFGFFSAAVVSVLMF
jgi:hypothetical protein